MPSSFSMAATRSTLRSKHPVFAHETRSSHVAPRCPNEPPCFWLRYMHRWVVMRNPPAGMKRRV